MNSLNIIYGLLTNGVGTGRKFTPITLTETQTKLRDALVDTLQGADGAAELYIRLCQTDKELKQLLNTVDPLNTYSLVERTPCIPKNSFDIPKINSQILGLGLPDIENSGSEWDNIKLCLKALLKSLI